MNREVQTAALSVKVEAGRLKVAVKLATMSGPVTRGLLAGASRSWLKGPEPAELVALEQR